MTDMIYGLLAVGRVVEYHDNTADRDDGSDEYVTLDGVRVTGELGATLLNEATEIMAGLYPHAIAFETTTLQSYGSWQWHDVTRFRLETQ